MLDPLEPKRGETKMNYSNPCPRPRRGVGHLMKEETKSTCKANGVSKDMEA